VGFDPGDGEVMLGAADGSEKAPDLLNERLVASTLDGVVPEESYAILAVGYEVDAPSDHRKEWPVHVSNPLESVVKCADLLSCVVRGTGDINLVRIRAIVDHRAPEGGERVLGSGDVRPRLGPGRLHHPCT